MEKCNHLVPKTEQNKKCVSSDLNSRIHYWIPSGRIEAIFNGMISVDFMCKYCNRRITNFLTQDEFNLNKRILSGV
jgi:hypothetical protein